MIFSLIFYVYSVKDVDYASTETAHFYSFDCQEGMRLNYIPNSKYQLSICSTTKELSATKKSLFASSESQIIDLGEPTKQDDYFIFSPNFSENESISITFHCPSGLASISLLDKQKVTSEIIVNILGIISCVFVGGCISLICIQFLTFHKKKVD